MTEEELGLHLLEIEITNKCNLNCLHCYVDRTKPMFMQPQEVYKLIDFAIKHKITRLIFTGGEPLLCPDLFQYANYARDKGINSLFLMTNGLLLNEANIQKCKVFDEIQLSLDELPNSKASIRNDYLKILEKKFELLRKNNILFLLFVTLNKLNYELIPDFVQYARSQDAYISFNCLVPLYPELHKLTLNQKQLYQVLKEINTFSKSNNHVSFNNHFKVLVDPEEHEVLEQYPKNQIVGGCLAGIASAYITVKGDVYACPFLKIPAGNVFKNPLDDIWLNSNLLNSLRKRHKFKKPCGNCTFLSMCGGCRALSYIKTGDYLGADSMCIKGEIYEN
ncbi:MAG: radical SAM protein [Alphaproteobacteria bacterium]|nr:radical SAM protein [Alphaproteobacteria bacterium]